MINKKVGIYWKRGISVTTDTDYHLAFNQLSNEVNKLGAEFYMVAGIETYLGNGNFTRSWQYKDGKIVETGPVKLDKMWNRGGFPRNINDIKILRNSKELYQMCKDKYATYNLLKEFCPITYKVGNEKELKDCVIKIPSTLKVVKPNSSFGGKDILINTNEHILQNVTQITYPVLVQEFLDSSGGIPNITNGKHDLRVIFVGEKIVSVYVRIPQGESLLSNTALGGLQINLPLDSVPKSAIRLVSEVKQKMRTLPNEIFTIDMMFVDGKPYLLELNSSPGLSSKSITDDYSVLKETIARILVNDEIF